MKRKYAVMTIALIMALNPVSIYASGDSTADTDAVFDDVSDSEEDSGTDENESFNTYVIGQVTDITDTTLEIKVGCLTDTTEDISEYTDMSGAEAADEDTADEDTADEDTAGETDSGEDTVYIASDQISGNSGMTLQLQDTTTVYDIPSGLTVYAVTKPEYLEVITSEDSMEAAEDTEAENAAGGDAEDNAEESADIPENSSDSSGIYSKIVDENAYLYDMEISDVNIDDLVILELDDTDSPVSITLLLTEEELEDISGDLSSES